ncbi:MAG: hypothetical protein NT154_00535, partial [Verrucomicrobia bacterium]|nr:hypothetical protein [Verrucomicrobiota bacterium]
MKHGIPIDAPVMTSKEVIAAMNHAKRSKPNHLFRFTGVNLCRYWGKNIEFSCAFISISDETRHEDEGRQSESR